MGLMIEHFVTNMHGWSFWVAFRGVELYGGCAVGKDWFGIAANTHTYFSSQKL
jgi:hypothetical protein